MASNLPAPDNPGRDSAPHPRRWPPGLWWILLGIQAGVFAILIHRQLALFDLSHDFAAYWQAIWWMGAHHRWFPPDSVFGWPALANNAEWVMWPIGFLGYAIWPHPSLLLIVQDGCLLGAEAIAWAWLAEATRTRLDPLLRFGFLGAAMIVLTANPWVLSTALFAFHTEAIAALGIVGAAWALWRHRWTALAAWTVLALACGTIGILLVIGLAISAVLQHRYRIAGILAGVGCIMLAIISMAHLNDGSVLAPTYAYLFVPAHPSQVSAVSIIFAAIQHPGRPLAALWGNAPELLENWLPTGCIGWISLAVIGPIGVLTAVNNLVQPHLGTNFARPGFQSVSLYALLAVGAFLTLLRGVTHAHPWLRALAWNGLLVIVMLTVSLADVGGPREWMPAHTAPGQTLARIISAMPPQSEVIASQAIIGRFANRPWAYAILRREHFPLHTASTNVLITPEYLSSTLLPAGDQRAAIHDLLTNPRATLVQHRNHVWWFRVAQTPQGLSLPYPNHHLPPLY